MTPEPVILAPNATVAEALARIRDPDLPVPLAAQVFVCQPAAGDADRSLPGRRRHPAPAARGAEQAARPVPGRGRGAGRRRCSDREVAERLAAYDVVALAVTDAANRLVGAVTIDDVLDRMLPANWRMARVRELMARGDDLSTPRGTPGGPVYDPDAFARFAERMARFLGTGRYLAAQTFLVILWIVLNLTAASLRWDPYPFILLNLAFSTQAAYAAPMILLAQNRQADRERAEVERDREINARSLAEIEYLAREIAGVRLALERKADREDVVEALDRLTRALGENDEVARAARSPRPRWRLGPRGAAARLDNRPGTGWRRGLGLSVCSPVRTGLRTSLCSWWCCLRADAGRPRS